MAAFRFFRTLFGGESSKSAYETAKIYDGLRKQILQFTAERLGAGANKRVLAALMETGYPEAVATLAAVMDGSASLYFSNGGGIIGGGEKPGPNAAARKLVAQAAGFESACALATEFPLPQQAHTRFYIITPSGVLTAEARENNLGKGEHPMFRSSRGSGVDHADTAGGEKKTTRRSLLR